MMTKFTTLSALLLASLLSTTSSVEPLTAELEDEEAAPEQLVVADELPENADEVLEVVPDEDYQDERELQYVYGAAAAAPVYGAYGAAPVYGAYGYTAYGGYKSCGKSGMSGGGRCGFAVGAVPVVHAPPVQSLQTTTVAAQAQPRNDPTVIVVNADSGRPTHSHSFNTRSSGGTNVKYVSDSSNLVGYRGGTRVYGATSTSGTTTFRQANSDPTVVYIDNSYGATNRAASGGGSVVYEYGSDPDIVGYSTVRTNTVARQQPSYVSYSTGGTTTYTGTRGGAAYIAAAGKGVRE